MRVFPSALILSLASLAAAGCGASHTVDDEPDAAPGSDASPGTDAGPVMVDPPPTTGCGDEPEAIECRELCDDACEHFASCGGDGDACIDGCYEAYACPGETPGHDAAICGGGFTATSCEATCRWVETFGGYGRGGPTCPTTPPMEPCEGRAYCDCTGECEPLIDLTPGCVCPCDDPFNCSGETCDCACGGAEYLGCAPKDLCEETEVSCDDPAGAELNDGCPSCPI